MRRCRRTRSWSRTRWWRQTRRWRRTNRWRWTVDDEVEAVEEGEEDEEVGVEEEAEADEEVEIRPSSSRFVADPLLPMIAEHRPSVGAWLR